MQQLSRIIDDFLRIVMQDNSVKAIVERLSTSDDASEELDAVQESLGAIATNSNEFVTEIHRFSIASENDKVVENLRKATANLVRSVELFKHTLTDLHPKADVDGHSLVDRLSASKQTEGANVDEADRIAHEKVLTIVALHPHELGQLVEEARQTHLSIARRINRFSAVLEWESGLHEEA